MDLPRPLPNELVRQILLYLQNDKLTLRNVCLSSKDLCSLAQGVMYRAIHLDRDSTPDGRLVQLIRTLVDRHELAMLVRTLSFSVTVQSRTHRDMISQDELPDYAKASKDAGLINACAARAAAYDGNFNTHTPEIFTVWQQMIKQNRQSAFGGLLLFMTTRITDLSITVYQREDSQEHHLSPLRALFGQEFEFEAINSHSNSLVTVGRDIRALKLSLGNSALLWSMNHNLKALDFDLTQPLDSSRLYDDLFSNLPFINLENLRSLVLRCKDSDLGLGALESSLLKALVGLAHCRLSSIQIRFKPELGNGDLYRPVQFWVLTDSIQKHVPALEELTIDIDTPPGGFNTGFVAKCWSTGSFHYFGYMRKLVVLQQTLVDQQYWDLLESPQSVTSQLPPCIEDLTLIGLNGDILPWLDTLIAALEMGSYESLRHLKLSCHQGWGFSTAWFIREGSSIFAKLSALGVEVTI